jgi:crotonobetainyl-CoA:carnitine CoA-transferase CaiB-like acyl-CoA transferase
MRPFSNIRVIDLTHVIAGPFCTYQLAVLGADVIKVEPPESPDMCRPTGAEFPYGDKGLSHLFTCQNANKRAVSINLRSEAGIEVLNKLIGTADVLVENYRAGALQALGLGYDDVKQIKPDIIYCSMTGFGQDGPNSGRTAYDNVIQAYSGLMSATGTAETGPVKVGPPVLDYGTGIQAAFAISAALYQRTFTGEGQRIDIAMLDSAIMLMSSNVTCFDQTGSLTPLSGNSSASNAGYGCYETKQGQLMIGAYTGKQVSDMWLVLGDAGQAERMINLQSPELAAYQKTDSIRISEILMQKTADEWEQAFNTNKVPAARVRSLDETLSDDHLNHRKVIQTLEDDEYQARIPVASFKYAKNGPKLDSLPPQFAEHTQQVLEELGYNEKDISDLEFQDAIARTRS